MNNTACFIYHERLGDIIQTISIAKQCHQRYGWNCSVECLPKYHSIFELVKDVHPVHPGESTDEQRFFDLQIWPNKYSNYRNSGYGWWHYVTHIYPETQGMKFINPFEITMIPMVNGFDQNTLLIVPTGYSQYPRITSEVIIARAKYLYPHLKAKIIGEQNGHHKFDSLVELVGAIRYSCEMITINTSTTYIAHCVRDRYDHIPQIGFGGQDDFYSVKQTRHHLSQYDN